MIKFKYPLGYIASLVVGLSFVSFIISDLAPSSRFGNSEKGLGIKISCIYGPNRDRLLRLLDENGSVFLPVSFSSVDEREFFVPGDYSNSNRYGEKSSAIANASSWNLALSRVNAREDVQYGVLELRADSYFFAMPEIREGRDVEFNWELNKFGENLCP